MAAVQGWGLRFHFQHPVRIITQVYFRISYPYPKKNIFYHLLVSATSCRSLKYRRCIGTIFIFLELICVVVAFGNFMPFKTIADLPDSIRNHLPEHAQEIYPEAFNHGWEEYSDPA
jgi:predicted nucleotidyltransferase